MADIDAVTTSGAILGTVLVKLRTEKGIKQGELADAIGISPSTWSRIEKGDSGLSIDQLRAAAKTLGVKPGLILEMVEAAEQEIASHGVRIAPTWATTGITGGATGLAAIIGASAIPIAGAALGGIIAGVMSTLLEDKKDKKDK